MFEDEQQLGQLVQGLVAVPEVRPVAVTGQGPVAKSVDGGDGQVGQVLLVTQLAGVGGQTVPHFVGGFLGESAQRHLFRFRLLQQQQVQGPQDDAVGFAGAGAGYHQERAVQMADDLLLAGV